ncbi:hypothetical protein ABZ858_37110 [Streptomyces sp. NPDC047017]|uniref:hypothetical protein n=1 Tax=Streptomyces sp. NPDC047017 TaxID=3155024 RepID=UPI0033D970D0
MIQMGSGEHLPASEIIDLREATPDESENEGRSDRPGRSDKVGTAGKGNAEAGTWKASRKSDRKTV